MVRPTRSEKVKRLNAAYTLLDQGVTASEAARQLSRHFGLPARQAGRHVRDARAMARQAESVEASVPITIKIPGTLAATLRAPARCRGLSIWEIVTRALRRFLSEPGRHG
ncbi:MAG: hypothetical protein OXI81_12495 [Paracoccaceae bacterium]|nr:hypothetical protein [Paracoccaceae bacterium]